MRDSLLLAQQNSTEELREQRRRKRNPSDERAKKYKTSVPTPESRLRPQGEVATKNFFAPLRTAEMDVERTLVEGTSDEPSSMSQQPSSNKAGRPPPIVLTSAINLMKLQRHIRYTIKGNFEFRNSRSGTRIVTKEM
jgi:hypothetical protein